MRFLIISIFMSVLTFCKSASQVSQSKSLEPAVNPMIETPPTTICSVNSTATPFVNLREGSDINPIGSTKVIAQLAPGSKLIRTAAPGREQALTTGSQILMWLQVKTESNLVGWIAAKFITCETIQTTPTPSPSAVTEPDFSQVPVRTQSLRAVTCGISPGQEQPWDARFHIGDSFNTENGAVVPNTYVTSILCINDLFANSDGFENLELVHSAEAGVSIPDINFTDTDNFTAYYENTLIVPADNSIYRMEFMADDGMKIYFNGALVSSYFWQNSGPTTFVSKEFPLKAGAYDIVLKSYEIRGRFEAVFRIYRVDNPL